MKFIAKSFLLLIIIFINACSDWSKSADENQESIVKTNCYEIVGDIPNLTILNSEYYGKVFIGITYDTTNNIFEKYSILRSTIYKKSDSSVFSTYDSDSPKFPAPDVYNQIVKEVKRRVDSSGVAMKRRNDTEECTEINWIILRVLVE